MSNKREIDKNDVDISQLFRWSREVLLRDPAQNLDKTVYLRLIGDADLNRARSYALRKAAEIRKDLNTEGTDARIAFMNEIKDFKDKDTLIAMIVLLSLPDLNSQALEYVEVPEPAEPRSDASQEDRENFQIKVDTYPERFAKAVEDKVNKLIEERKEELNNSSKKELYETYKALLIDRICSEEMTDRFYDKCIFFATYLGPDLKKRAFTDFDDFEDIAPVIKDILKDAYRNLELGVSELKKSHEATDSE